MLALRCRQAPQTRKILNFELYYHKIQPFKEKKTSYFPLTRGVATHPPPQLRQWFQCSAYPARKSWHAPLTGKKILNFDPSTLKKLSGAPPKRPNQTPAHLITPLLWRPWAYLLGITNLPFYCYYVAINLQIERQIKTIRSHRPNKKKEFKS